MSTTGTVINCVFNTIAELGDTHCGSPFVDIVDTVKANILNRNIVPQPRNVESHTLRAIKYGLQAGIIAEPQNGCYKILEAPRIPVAIAEEDVNVDDASSVEYNDASDDDYNYDDNAEKFDDKNDYSENDKRLGQHQFYNDEDINADENNSDNSDEECCQSDGDETDECCSNDQSCDEAGIDEPDVCCEEPPCCEEESECCSEDSDECDVNDNDAEDDADSEFYGDAENDGNDDNDNLPDNEENNNDEQHPRKCCGRRTCGRDDSIVDNKNRSHRDDRVNRDDRCGNRCEKQPRCEKPPEMNCEPTQPCCPKQPNNPCKPRNPKNPCEPNQPCCPWSPYSPKNPKNPKEPEGPKEPQPPTRCTCCPRPNKCKTKCRDEPEHFGSHKDEHFDENESDDFDNSIKSYEVDDFKGDFKENNQNQRELEQIGNTSCGPSCGPACGGGCCDDSLGKKRRQSDSNDNDSKSIKRHRASVPNDKFNIASITIAHDPMKEINLVDTTSGYVKGEADDNQLKIIDIDSSLDAPMDYNPKEMELVEFPSSNA